MMDAITKALNQYWGYTTFLPLQAEAMACIAEGRDSVVVLPTGGGKSLCFQAPAVTLPGLAVVVSPLIALMKDQVDGLIQCGVLAGRLDSSQSASDQQAVMAAIGDGTLKLLYLSPERLLSNGFPEFLETLNISFFAIDEAHCVSMWGHDFRPEYRQLGRLKKLFPDIPVAAYTATATEQVQTDIAEQLGLRNARLLIGSFDRPNLVYKSQPRTVILQQVCQVLDRHKEESGVIYCLRRKDVDQMCAQLNARGYCAAPYHAGMSDADRKASQDRFITEQVHIIVATIAFGMGIDKSNVRYVIHAGMPKSLEHYQQESGRAGRDGLEAECCLFYGGGDYGLWQFLMRDMPEEAKRIATFKLSDMYSYCTGGLCRHRAILNYFGQTPDKDNCGACDVCLGHLETMDDGFVLAQKILSCIVRLEQRFGAGYTARVLLGSKDQRILESGHDTLSTYGLLSDRSKHAVRDWIEQLVGQGCIEKTGEYNVLTVTPKGWQVLRGQLTPRLFKAAEKPAKVSRIATDSWQGVDRGLFEALRQLRNRIAKKSRLPAYLIFGDATLRDLARQRPATPAALLNVKGVGQKKCDQYGQAVLDTISSYCRTHDLQRDTTNSTDVPNTGQVRSGARQAAFKLFARQRPLKEVAASVRRAESTALQYLVEYIGHERIVVPQPWVDEPTFDRIAEASQNSDLSKIKPVFEQLNGHISYDAIRISLACLRNR